MPMTDHLTGLFARIREAKAEHHVINAALKQPQQILAGNALHRLCFLIISTELLLQHTVDELCFLLLLQLQPVLTDLAVRTARLALGFFGTTNHSRLKPQCTAPLEGWYSINCHLTTAPPVILFYASADGIHCAGLGSRP